MSAPPCEEDFWKKSFGGLVSPPALGTCPKPSQGGFMLLFIIPTSIIPPLPKVNFFYLFSKRKLTFGTNFQKMRMDLKRFLSKFTNYCINKNPPVNLVVFHISGKTLHYRQHEIVRSLTMPIANLSYFLNGSFISYIVICSIILSSFNWFAIYCCIVFLFFPTVST